MDTPFARFMDRFGSILWTGILWLIVSLPVVTIPAASMAACHTVAQVIRKNRGYLTRTFFGQFRKYTKKWFTVSLADLLILAWLLFDIIYLHGYGTEFSKTLSYITYGIMAVYLAVNLRLFSFGSRFGGSRIEIFKLSVYATFRHLLSTVLLLLMLGAGAYLVWLMPWSILLLPGLLIYVASLVSEPVLRHYTKGFREPERGKRIFAEEEGEIEEERRGNLLIRKKKKRSTEEAEEEEEDPEEEEEDFRDRVVPKE